MSDKKNVIFMGREISSRDTLKLRGKNPGIIPCKEQPGLYSNPYLEDFNEEMFLLDHPELNEDQREVIEAAREAHQELKELSVAKAKELCNTCPLLNTCREWVIEEEPETGNVYGVVGGMTPEERRKIQKQNARKARKEAKLRAEAAA